MSLPVNPPVKPMLARPVRSLPDDSDTAELLFEPKWDGFRCLVFRDGAEITLQSRSGKSLNRYFPEVVDRLTETIPERAVLDGELVVATGGRLDFDALTERIHPARSRVRTLAERTPARYVAFDVLAHGDESLLDQSTITRRERLVALTAPGFDITPASVDPGLARHWFTLFEGAGLDGVIGKPGEAVYTPNKRTLLKYKHSRTADCVVAGLRWHSAASAGEAVGSLLLGLHDESGVLHHVGVVGSFTGVHRRKLATELTPLITDGTGHPWLESIVEGQRLPGTINRWRSGEQPWVPLRVQRVAEVSYEHTEGGHPGRFRHTAQFLRWRDDRDPRSCEYDQLDEPARYDLDAVFRGEVRRTR